jgi:hypothetical protein
MLFYGAMAVGGISHCHSLQKWAELSGSQIFANYFFLLLLRLGKRSRHLNVTLSLETKPRGKMVTTQKAPQRYQGSVLWSLISATVCIFRQKNLEKAML